MGQTSGMEDWTGLLSERFLRHGAYFVPAGEYDWSGDRVQVYTPELEISDGPDAWHPDDALMVPLRSARRRAAGDRLRRRAGHRPPPVAGRARAAQHRRRHAAVAVEQAQTRRARAPPPRRGGAPARGVGPADRAADGGGGARLGLLGRARGARLPQGRRLPRRGGQARAAVGRRLHARAGRGVSARAGRGARAAARLRVPAPRLRRDGARRGRRALTPEFGGVVLVGRQRARAARLEPPLGRRAAARLGPAGSTG